MEDTPELMKVWITACPDPVERWIGKGAKLPAVCYQGIKSSGPFTPVKALEFMLFLKKCNPKCSYELRPYIPQRRIKWPLTRL